MILQIKYESITPENEKVIPRVIHIRRAILRSPPHIQAPPETRICIYKKRNIPKAPMIPDMIGTLEKGIPNMYFQKQIPTIQAMIIAISCMFSLPANII